MTSTYGIGHHCTSRCWMVLMMKSTSHLKLTENTSLSYITWLMEFILHCHDFYRLSMTQQQHWTASLHPDRKDLGSQLRGCLVFGSASFFLLDVGFRFIIMKTSSTWYELQSLCIICWLKSVYIAQTERVRNFMKFVMMNQMIVNLFKLHLMSTIARSTNSWYTLTPLT